MVDIELKEREGQRETISAVRLARWKGGREQRSRWTDPAVFDEGIVDLFEDLEEARFAESLVLVGRSHRGRP